MYNHVTFFFLCCLMFIKWGTLFEHLFLRQFIRQ